MTKEDILENLKKIYGNSIYKTGIYKISFKDSNHSYIGIATRKNKFNCNSGFYNRWKRHLFDLNKNTHSNRFLSRVFNKEGFNSINFEILEFLENEDECVEKEVKYFKEHKPNLNYILNQRKPYRHFYTKEERKRRSELQKGRKHSEETKRLMSKKSKGNSRGRIKIDYKILLKSRNKILNGESNLINEYKNLGISRPTLNRLFKENFNYEEIVKAAHEFNFKKLNKINKARKGKNLSYNKNTINKIINLYKQGKLIKEIRPLVNLNEDLIGKLIKENMNTEELKKIRSKNAIRK